MKVNKYSGFKGEGVGGPLVWSQPLLSLLIGTGVAAPNLWQRPRQVPGDSWQVATGRHTPPGYLILTSLSLSVITERPNYVVEGVSFSERNNNNNNNTVLFAVLSAALAPQLFVHRFPVQVEQQNMTLNYKVAPN